MISSPGCLCLPNATPGSRSTRTWTTSCPGMLRSCRWRSVHLSPGCCARATCSTKPLPTMSTTSVMIRAVFIWPPFLLMQSVKRRRFRRRTARVTILYVHLFPYAVKTLSFAFTIVWRSYPQLVPRHKECRSHHRQLLQVDQFHHALLREREQVEELLLGERNFLGRALHLDDPSGAGHDEIGIGVGLGILGIVEVEHRRAVGDAAGNGGDMVAQRVGLEHVAGLHPGDAIVQRDPGAGNGRRARSAIGLDHVAIDRDLPLAQRGQIE